MTSFAVVIASVVNFVSDGTTGVCQFGVPSPPVERFSLVPSTLPSEDSRWIFPPVSVLMPEAKRAATSLE